MALVSAKDERVIAVHLARKQWVNVVLDGCCNWWRKDTTEEAVVKSVLFMLRIKNVELWDHELGDYELMKNNAGRYQCKGDDDMV